MAKNKSGDTEYRLREENEPHRQTGNIDARNNNTAGEASAPSEEPTIERANHTGIGDSGMNDDKLTNYTQNHSADA